MECLKCDDGKTTVTDTITFGATAYRHRKCKICGYRFWTEEHELIDEDGLHEAISYKNMKRNEKLKRQRAKKRQVR